MQRRSFPYGGLSFGLLAPLVFPSLLRGSRNLCALFGRLPFSSFLSSLWLRLLLLSCSHFGRRGLLSFGATNRSGWRLGCRRTRGTTINTQRKDKRNKAPPGDHNFFLHFFSYFCDLTNSLFAPLRVVLACGHVGRGHCWVPAIWSRPAIATDGSTLSQERAARYIMGHKSHERHRRGLVGAQGAININPKTGIGVQEATIARPRRTSKGSTVDSAPPVPLGVVAPITLEVGTVASTVGVACAGRTRCGRRRWTQWRQWAGQRVWATAAWMAPAAGLYWLAVLVPNFVVFALTTEIADRPGGVPTRPRP